MDALDWKLPEMNGRDGSHVAPSTEMHTTTRDAEPFVSNLAQKETATGRACDKQTTVAWQGGRNVSTGPLDGRFLVTYPSGGRQTWVRKQSQKELLDPLGIAVGDGGVPSDAQALDAVDRVQELEEDAVSEEDRDAAVRWVDASDLLLSGDESEESGGCMDKGDYFTVSLSECGDRDSTGAGSDRSPTSLSPTASVLGSSLRPQMEQEAVSLLQRSSSGSLEKDPADHEVTAGMHVKLLGSDGGDGRVEPLVPAVEAQRNVLAAVGIQQVDMRELKALFTEKEVWETIKEMPGDRAPGPDGFIGAFYQRAWPVINPDIMACLLKLGVGDGRGFARLNRALITLIPKKQDAMEIEDYRPISLVHSFAKLFSKLVANQLRSRLGEVVSANQSAFVKGRCLHDNFMLVRQVARKINPRMQT
ncbi:hypothetical protein ACQ4PT_018145 [Festuca glaucescens]